MKRTYLIAGALAAVFLVPSNPAQARDNCRDYRETRIINGFYETGFATVCESRRGYWEIRNITGPVELRSPLIETVKRDVFRIGGLQVSLTSSNFQPAYVYKPRRDGFVTYSQPTTYVIRDSGYKNNKHKHYKKHWKNDRRDHDSRDHRRDRRWD